MTKPISKAKRELVLEEIKNAIDEILIKNKLDPEKTPLLSVLQTIEPDGISNAIAIKNFNKEGIRALMLCFFDVFTKNGKEDMPFFVTLYLWLKMNNKLKVFSEYYNHITDFDLSNDSDKGSYFDNDSETMH